jgi:hypothetical protein
MIMSFYVLVEELSNISLVGIRPGVNRRWNEIRERSQRKGFDVPCSDKSVLRMVLSFEDCDTLGSSFTALGGRRISASEPFVMNTKRQNENIVHTKIPNLPKFPGTPRFFQFVYQLRMPFQQSFRRIYCVLGVESPL